MSSLDSLVRNYFRSLEENENEFTGYIDGSGEFSRFVEDLRAIGFMFVIRDASVGSSLLFSHTRKGAKTQIPFFGPLFQITKNHTYECRFGNNRSHGSKHSGNETELTKERSCVPSKKIGCEAMMHVSQLTIYPEYTISEYNSNGSIKQTEMRRKLQEAIKASKSSPKHQASRPPTTAIRYSISISRESLHSHSLAAAQASQLLHPKLVAEIKRLASTENVTVPQVRIHLEAFVQRMIKERNVIAPNRQNRRYYPTHKVISKHLYRVTAAKAKIRSDRITLEKYMESRGYSDQDRNEDGKTSFDDKTDSETKDKKSLTENEEKPSDDSREGTTNPETLVKVKIVAPNLSSIQSPSKNAVPKLQVVSGEADITSLRSEILKLIDELSVHLYAVEDVKVLQTVKTYLIAANLALAEGRADKTILVLLRSLACDLARRVTPVVIRDRVAFKMDKDYEYGDIL